MEEKEVKKNKLETSKTDRKSEVKYYEVRMWAGRIKIYQCCKCKRQMDSEDDMILHVLKHCPESKRDRLFEKLVKEKEDGK